MRVIKLLSLLFQSLLSLITIFSFDSLNLCNKPVQTKPLNLSQFAKSVKIPNLTKAMEEELLKWNTLQRATRWMACKLQKVYDKLNGFNIFIGELMSEFRSFHPSVSLAQDLVLVSVRTTFDGVCAPGCIIIYFINQVSVRVSTFECLGWLFSRKSDLLSRWVISQNRIFDRSVSVSSTRPLLDGDSWKAK